jgi:hypothetical protein
MADLEQSYVTWRGKYVYKTRNKTTQTGIDCCYDGYRYLRSYEDSLYVYYKEKGEGLKEVTCSEAHGKHRNMMTL